MESIPRKAFILILVALLTLACNLPLASLLEKSGDESSGDNDAPAGEKSSGEGVSFGGTGQKLGKEKPLSGNVEVIKQAFWPYQSVENGLVIAALVKNTDTELTVFHPTLKFQLLDSSGQPIELQEGQTMRLEDGSNQLFDMVLYPGQEYLFCERVDIRNRLAGDVSSLVVTTPDKLKGIDLGITSNPLTASKTSLTNLGDVYRGELQSGVVINNSMDRMVFAPAVTTAGFDESGNIINCGGEYQLPIFIRGNSQAASTFRMFNVNSPASYQSYIAQQADDYLFQENDLELKQSNQLSLSDVSFVQNKLDLIPVYYLSNNNDKNGDFNYYLTVFAYDAAGDVAGVYSSGPSSLFAPGTRYGPFSILQNFMIPGKQAEKVVVDVLTWDFNKLDFNVPVIPVEYGPASYNPGTNAIDTQATNQADSMIFLEGFAACYDEGHNLIGYGWNTVWLEKKTTVPFELYTFDLGGNSCASATTIEINTVLTNYIP